MLTALLYRFLCSFPSVVLASQRYPHMFDFFVRTMIDQAERQNKRFSLRWHAAKERYQPNLHLQSLIRFAWKYRWFRRSFSYLLMDFWPLYVSQSRLPYWVERDTPFNACEYYWLLRHQDWRSAQSAKTDAAQHGWPIEIFTVD